MKLRPSHAVAAGAAVLGMMVAAPALAGVGQAADPGKQPPAGAKVVKSSDFRLGKQPVNRNPQPTHKTVKVRVVDKGVKNLPAKQDRGKKNLPVTRDRGAR